MRDERRGRAGCVPSGSALCAAPQHRGQTTAGLLRERSVVEDRPAPGGDGYRAVRPVALGSTTSNPTSGPGSFGYRLTGGRDVGLSAPCCDSLKTTEHDIIIGYINVVVYRDFSPCWRGLFGPLW
jgi:hypothetical protein